MTDLLEYLYYPFTLPLMQRAILAALATGIVCALLSCFLVLKGWSLMGDAISHAVLPGIVLAFLAGIPIIIGAFASGLLCSVATGYIKENSRIKVDTSQHLNHILFGSVLGTSYAELEQIILIAGIVSAIVIIKRRDLLLYCFDPVQAKVVGLPVKLLHYGLLCILALTIVSSLKTAGVILVIAMLIAPGIIAFSLTKRFERMLLIAVIVSMFSTVIGTLISFYLDASTSACIVILQATIFLGVQIYQFIVRQSVRN